MPESRELYYAQINKLELMKGQNAGFLKWANNGPSPRNAEREFKLFVLGLHLSTIDLLRGGDGEYLNRSVTALEDAARGNVYTSQQTEVNDA